MPADPPRTLAQRKADTIAKLSAQEVDVWVATARSIDTGVADPYLVPLSLAWVGERIVLALEATSRTAANIIAGRRTRLGLGPTRDVVMIDAALDEVVGVGDAPAELAGPYVEQTRWDPRGLGGKFVFLVLRPERIQAWREANELANRTIMRRGAWVA